jgi:hypothetical protein
MFGCAMLKNNNIENVHHQEVHQQSIVVRVRNIYLITPFALRSLIL